MTEIQERATDGSLRTGHPLDEHEFCPKCGFCVECEDCAIWGCGSIDNKEADDA